MFLVSYKEINLGKLFAVVSVLFDSSKNLIFKDSALIWAWAAVREIFPLNSQSEVEFVRVNLQFNFIIYRGMHEISF